MLCPACRSPRVYLSRPRTLVERLRKALSVKAPHRCHDCGWRRWALIQNHPAGPDVRPDDLRANRPTRTVLPADLDRLDPGA